MATVEKAPSQVSAPVSLAVSVAAAILAAGLVSALYWPSWSQMALIWVADPNYTHGFAVPLVSLVLAGSIWRQGQSPFESNVTPTAGIVGLALVTVGFAVHMLAWFLAHWFLDVVSLVVLLNGLLMLAGGRRAASAYRFPVLFLLFMAPLPVAWYQPAALAMQQIASGLACFVLETFGVAASRDGHMIYLPRYTLEVGAACSGLRQITTLVAGSVLLGYLMARSATYRWTLAASSFVIAIVANSLRIVLIGAVMMMFGRKWADGVFHTMEGVFVTILAALLILCFANVLARWEDRWKRRSARNGEPAA